MDFIMSRKIRVKSNARELKSGFTLERGKLAQSLMDQFWSTERIAAEVGVSIAIITKWRKIGLLKAIDKPTKLAAGFRRRNLEKLKTATELLAQGKSTPEIAEKINLSQQQVNIWKRRGYLNEQHTGT
jgi:transposase